MIFQASVALNINGKEVHVVFDMDTGMIGFTEISDGEHIEYSYQSCPPEFRVSFAQFMDGLIGKTHQSNGLICRKSGAYQVLQEFWKSEN